MAAKRTPTTALCHHDDASIYVRGRDLCEMIGRVTFTDMIWFDIFGRMPTEAERRITDAVFLTLIEHGLSPSAIATRMVYCGAPESIQGAVGAGLLSIGGTLAGTLERCARLLDEIVEAPDGMEAAAARIAARYKESGERLPGFGHPHFRPVDPRTPRLYALVEELGLPGRHVAAARALSAAADAAFGKPLTVNASTAMAAVLREIDVPGQIMRGFALICRSAGLVAHVYEEQRNPAAWTILETVEKAVPYADDIEGD